MRTTEIHRDANVGIILPKVGMKNTLDDGKESNKVLYAKSPPRLHL
jgi:hypothetical protein